MIDLHTHSTESDGTLPPEELIALAAKEGLSGLALTDHDTMTGIPRAERAAAAAGLKFIPGIELDLDYADGDFHLLGLNLTGNTSALKDALAQLLVYRKERNQKILEKMNAAGIQTNYEELREMAPGELILKPHLARLLMKKGVTTGYEEGFSRFLNKGRPFYVKRKLISPEEGMEIIHKAGGLCIMAHPITLNLKEKELSAFLDRMKETGLDGVEAYHSSHEPEYCEFLKELAQEKGLIYTGGSDFHGTSRPERRLGRIKDGRPIPPGINRFLE